MAEAKDSCVQPARGPIGVKETKSEYMGRFRRLVYSNRN